MKIDKDIRQIMQEDFVVFILTHGRANHVVTYNTLHKLGYKGRVVMVIDNEDSQGEEYKRLFGEENVYVFDKARVAETFDEGVTGDRRTVVYARNACFDIARELGYRYFMELDDDYDYFRFCFDANGNANWKVMHHKFTDCVAALLKFYIGTPPCVKSVAMGQNGDYIGGFDSAQVKSIRMKRKAMNSFICDTERPFQFIGRINEDVNTYTCNSHRGEVFLTVFILSLHQAETQSSEGGMTDVYLDTGTYLKSFFSVMYHPSGVKVSVMGAVEKRLHHKINWNNTAPRIMSERYKRLS